MRRVKCAQTSRRRAVRMGSFLGIDFRPQEPSHCGVAFGADSSTSINPNVNPRSGSRSPLTRRPSWATSSSSSCPMWVARLRESEAVAVVESVKAASDVFSPIAGEVTGVKQQSTRAGAGQRGCRGQGLVLQDQGCQRLPSSTH